MCLRTNRRELLLYIEDHKSLGTSGQVLVSIGHFYTHMTKQQTNGQQNTSEIDTTSVHRELSTHLTQALEADDAAIKNYHIRSVQQYLITIESSVDGKESLPTD
jgi:hypothetical protein